MKMLMFSKELKYNKDMYTIFKLERMNKFLALFYTNQWMTTTSAADAPIHDLQHDYQLASSVLKNMNNHHWYLT
jgi:hypothetical protein